jgi:hypothetical protein
LREKEKEKSEREKRERESQREKERNGERGQEKRKREERVEQKEREGGIWGQLGIANTRVPQQLTGKNRKRAEGARIRSHMVFQQTGERGGRGVEVLFGNGALLPTPPPPTREHGDNSPT